MLSRRVAFYIRAAACAARNGRCSVPISVSDNGHGISHAACPSIFQPFSTTKGLVGNDLGLWVSKQISEKHGGLDLSPIPYKRPILGNELFLSFWPTETSLARAGAKVY